MASKSKIWGYGMLFMGILFFLYEYILRVAPGVMTDDIRHTMHINISTFGLMNSLFFFSYTCMQVPVGMLLDKYSTRMVLSSACFACSLGTLFFAHAHSLTWAMFGRLLIGFGASFGLIGALKLAQIRLDKQHFAKASGWISGIGFSGAIISNNLLTYFLQKYHWQQLFYFLGALGVILSILLFYTIRDCHILLKKQENMTLSHVKKGIILIIKNPFLWVNNAIAFCYYFPTSVFAELFGQSYLCTVQNLSPEQATFAISLIFLGWAIGGPITGQQADRHHCESLLLCVGGIGAATSLSAVLYIPYIAFWGICLLLFAFGFFSATQIVNYSYPRKIAPHSFIAVAIGITNTCCVLGGAIFQPIIAHLLNLGWTGKTLQGLRIYEASDYKQSFYLLPIGLIIGAILSLFLKKTSQHLIPRAHRRQR